MCFSRSPVAVAGAALVFTVGAGAQTIQVAGSSDAQALAQAIVGQGTHLVPGSATLLGVTNQQGTFSTTGGDVVGVGAGVLLTTGSVQSAPGPNDDTCASSSLPNRGGDTALSAIAGAATDDANILQFRITVDADLDSLGLRFVFGSEEYNESVGSEFNDLIAIFVDGQNIALVPGSGGPIQVNSINGGNPSVSVPPAHAQFYKNNDPINPPIAPAGNLANTQLDGFTTPITADVLAALDPALTEHTIRIAIADVSDDLCDSALFIEAGSLTTTTPKSEKCQVAFEPSEPNDVCVGPFGRLPITKTSDCLLINGKLASCGRPGPQPDTWLCVFDKSGGLIASDDNGADGAGNGKGSGLLIGDGDHDGWSDLLVDNGDGTHSLRLGVTGFPDGFDGDCNGFFQNAPHGQIGAFTVTVDYISLAPGAKSGASEDLLRRSAQLPLFAGGAVGTVIRVDRYHDEFVTGAEAFRLNFTAPAGAEIVRITVDNTTGVRTVCDDVDFFCVAGLEPLTAYCLTVAGGLDKDCAPTDTQLCWLDKNCAVIGTDNDSGPTAGYSELCAIADANGTICVAVTGAGDTDCDGLVNGLPHGVCGNYLISVRRADSVSQPIFPGSCSDPASQSQIERAAQGDINNDGVVDGWDLAVVLANWGVLTAR